MHQFVFGQPVRLLLPATLVVDVTAVNLPRGSEFVPAPAAATECPGNAGGEWVPPPDLPSLDDQRKAHAEARCKLFNETFPVGAEIEHRSTDRAPWRTGKVTRDADIVQFGAFWHVVVQIDGCEHKTIELTEAAAAI